MDIDNRFYYQVTAWMINDLHLKGNELKCYAIIFSLSQLGQGLYYGGLDYLAKFMQVSQPTASAALNGLLEKDLIGKTPVITETGKRVMYFCKDGNNKNFIDGDNKKFMEGDNKNFIVPNRYNIIEDKNKSKSVSNDTQKVDVLFEKFWEKYGYKKSKKPTISAWRKLNKEQKEAAIKGIDVYKEDCAKHNRQMKHPSTYLNQFTWEDDFTNDGKVNCDDSHPEDDKWPQQKAWIEKFCPNLVSVLTREKIRYLRYSCDPQRMSKILRYLNDNGYEGDFNDAFEKAKEIWIED